MNEAARAYGAPTYANTTIAMTNAVNAARSRRLIVGASYI
jgi:hypothetical protein